ncbi:MAG: hypothetical protein L0H10_18015 [Comamonas sp.]|uniref:hypothetical protein n=1 Tax=Comamonas sp. TaxID=34028 RepID=UPI0026484B48|nr:hypothetical protein [Comamonas sp.]MDN5505688.1 hypothetical protein [Comamonas sp.]MDN5537435.1 hypothetical protein [Comamonas sp.]
MASPVDTSVKHAYSSMAGAPAIGGTAGSLIGALDAFLVNGWGAKAVDSAVISNGICRLNFASGKSAAEAHAVILVTGATPSALNGEQKVTAVANGWVEFKTDLPDGAVTGSISFKMAALGWEKVFAATNKVVYRPLDPRGTRPFVRIDDSNALFARVTMFESMTDIDAGTGVAPASVPGGYYWYKRSSDTSASYWVLAGDGRGFYIAISNNSGGGVPGTSNGYSCLTAYCGDLISARSGDAWCSVLTGAPSASASDLVGCPFQASAATGMSIQRGSTGLGGAIQTSRVVLGNSGYQSGADPSLGAFPARADNGLRLSPILLLDGAGTTNGPRGELPGGYHCPQTQVLATFGADVRLSPGNGQFAGKQLLSFCVGNPATLNQGIAFVDAAGPWR